MENWRDVVGYEGLYKVSSHGRVLSLLSEKIIKPVLMRNGYLKAGLHGRTIGKRRRLTSIHRLVMEAFRGPSELQVNHIDRNKMNNMLYNLEYVTAGENQAHSRAIIGNWNYRGDNHYKTKVSEKERLIVIRDHYLGSSVLAKKYGVAPATIRRIWDRAGIPRNPKTHRYNSKPISLREP